MYIYIFDGQNSQNHGFRWRFLEHQSIDQRLQQIRDVVQTEREVGLPVPWLIKHAIESSSDGWPGVTIRCLGNP